MSWFKGKEKAPRSKDASNPSVSQSDTSPASTSTGWEKARDTAIPILELVANIAEGSDALASLKAACKATKQILEMTRAIQNNKKDWRRLAERLQGHLESMEHQITIFEGYPEEKRQADNSLRDPLLAYVRKLDEIQKAVEARTRSRLLSRATKVDMDASDIQDFHQDIDDCHQRLTAALAVSTSLHVQAVKGDTEALKGDTQLIKEDAKTLLKDVDMIAIAQLPIVLSNSSMVHNPCNPGTRVAVLDTIRRWGEGEFSEPIFWLCDIAGSGKSTVSTSMVTTWKEAGLLGGQFFFSMTASEESTIAKMCPTFARQMFERIPALAPYVIDAVKQHPAIMTDTFEEQFKKLIVGPITHHRKPVIIIIDALDECRIPREREQLLRGFSLAVRSCPNLRIFLTSRPEPDIERLLGPLALKRKLEFRLHDASYSDNVDDVATYIHETLRGVLSREQRLNLIKKANGLFIWAKTVCQMFDPERRFEPPDVVYERVASREHSSDIDSIYQLILERIEPPNALQAAYKLLGVLVAAFEALTLAGLSKILEEMGQRVDVANLIKRLGNVLHVEPVTTLIRFRHPTFVEYLERCSSSGDYISLTKCHAELARWSLKTMSTGLKFNICQIDSSFAPNRAIQDFEDRVSRFIPRELRYASSHWLFHLSKMDDSSRQIQSHQIQYALQSPQVLYWVEVVGAILGVPRAITGLRCVASYFKGEIHERIEDTRRFMMAFSTPIQESLPHIYISALPFTPKKSKLYTEGLKKYPNSLTVAQGVKEMYPGLPKSLRGHESPVMAVGFSPDGSRIVSGSWDKTIRLWDADTGQPLGEPLRGHERQITAVAFSPDGSRIVSSSYDETIRLWDADTGQQWGEPLRGNNWGVTAVAFSPDGLRIVSGFTYGEIQLWDVNIGQPLGKPLQGHIHAVTSVVFSPDGSQIASSGDRAIRLWDANTGQPLGDPLRGHEGNVMTIAFSPDGLRIASGSDDETIRLWDANTGQPLGEPLRGHERSVRAVIFSPDGSRIVSGSHDKTIRLWDVDTGQQLGEPLQGHEDGVMTVGFSPDGSRIVSGSWEHTIRLWDVDTSQPLGEPLQGHEGNVMAVSFSPDDLRIVSGSDDKTVRMWDAKNGQPLGEPLQGHERGITAVAFSPNGSRIASGSYDQTIRLWDAGTGQMCGGPLRGHKGGVMAVAFSPDGLRIVSGSDDRTMRLWDVGTGQPLGVPFQGHEKGVTVVAFSSDGSIIVSGSNDYSIRLWNADTSQPLGKPIICKGSVWAVGFSPDGSKIASGGWDQTIQLWDAATGQPLGKPLQGHKGGIMAVAFSPDGSRIVSGSQDHKIQFWDANTGLPLGTAIRGHENEVGAVQFSRDGSKIVSGSHDRTIRLWDTDIDAKGSNQRGKGLTYSDGGDQSPGIPLGNLAGFERCSLLPDGWVQSSGRLLFWVPPENRHGLQHPQLLLTIPTTSLLRATILDFTHFKCGPSWTAVRGNS